MSNIIDVIKTFSDVDRMTREGGEKLRNQILALWGSTKTPLILEFHDKPVASVSFWDEGIAKLLEHQWTSKELKSRIHFKNLSPRDQQIIDQLIHARA